MSGADPPAHRQHQGPGLFLAAHPGQALLEAWLVGGLSLAGLFSLHAHLQPNVLTQGILFLSGGAALWCAVRSRTPRHRRRLTRWAGELLVAVALALSLAAGWGLGLWLLWEQVLSGVSSGLGGAVALLLAAGAEFLAFRAGVYLWLVWVGLRRRRLLWALTHMQVQVVFLFALLGVALLGIALFAGGYLPSRVAEQEGVVSVVTSLVLTILPVLGVALVATLVVLAAVLPPSVLFAYLLSRRTTRRLEALAEAAAKLRQGEVGTRVQVQGEDEVAQLQADFNAMAADLQRAMDDLQGERDRVAALLQARRELVAAVSHELRTPLTTVRGYLESSRASLGQQPPEDLRRDLEIVENEVVRLQELIDDLFTLSRVEAGGLALEIRPADVGALIRRRVAAMAPLAWQAGRVEVTAQVPPDLPLALADEGRLEQVLINLLHNGVRHTLPGGIVAVMASADDRSVLLEVRDTGEGIPASDLPHIWERFYRGTHGGTGLGLALVKELAEAMGGTVGVQSVVGQGSCFTVRLPRA